MDLQLTGKTALVTGASVGIGHAIARAFAAEGIQLCVAARRRDLLEQLSRQITAAKGPGPKIAEIDLMKEGGPKQLADEAMRALGHVDILVNCAGGSLPPIAIEGPDSEWDGVMKLNYVIARQLTHFILPGMIERKWGRVINISGKSEITRLVAVSPAKAAIHAWSKGISREVGKHGITVNCLAPGRIMSEQIRRKYSEAFRAEESAKEISLGRYGEPEELAAIATFVASPVASYLTGAVIPVDGGMRRYAF